MMERPTAVRQRSVAVIVVLFCFIAIVNTLVMAATDRRRDLAVLRLNGATRRQTLLVLTAGIFVFLFAFQEYLTAAVLTDTTSKTVPVFIATQLGQTLPMLQQAGAASMLLTVPVIAFAFIAQRYLVAGLSAGSVKG